ncbi:MAG: PKD domain-containing protein, partial [Firmicutes bacterium]|nr:PKD domain-containing protein [Bacillota bacterium]
LPHIPPQEYPGQALACALYLEGGIRSCEIGSVMFGKHDPDTGAFRPAPLEQVRLAVPRRVYTQSHMDYVIETIAAVFARRREIGGLRFLCSARIKTESVAGVTLKPCWQNRVGNWLVDEASQATLRGTNDWTELRVAYTAPPGAVGVGLVVMAEKGDGRGTLWVDDCAVEPLVTLTIGAVPGERPYTMEFNARLDLPGFITAYEWDFDGDGTADSDRPTPIHLFPGPGAYRCRLLATSADGSIYWTERTVTVLPALAIEVTWSEEEGFRLRETTGSGADLTSITWDFGDGTIYTGPEKEIVHAYRDGGRYTVRVTACDSYGNTATTTIEIDAPPSVEAAPVVIVEHGFLARFAANADVHYGGQIISAVWDCGDGTTAWGEDATHVYSALGTYQPALTLIDSFGYIHVFPAPAVTMTAGVVLSVHDGDIIRDVSRVTGRVVGTADVVSISILLDGLEQVVLPGSMEITWNWDTYLAANGPHIV